MKYIFGPINSRRFGLSLGIDLSPEVKSCNFDCLYCELEAAKPVDKISQPPSVEEIVQEVEWLLLKEPAIDVITITSNGEPTLYPDLEKLVDALNMIKGDKKLLILSNAATITDLNIQSIFQKIDIVKLSLDCVTQACFQKIDRPLNGIKIDKIIEGMKLFSKRFTHTLVIEVLVVEGINDKKVEMLALNEVLQEIKPSRIDLGTIDRPPAYQVKAVSSEKLKSLSSYFKRLPISIIHKEMPKIKVDFDEKAILETLRRRPQSQSDIDYLFSDSAKAILQKLMITNQVIQQNIAGVIFYSETKRILSK
ncbi:MAG: radical SAM protein [Epsilonproteobacteria bacterium]|nr:radical SAM protein [Campylobacterota bacterium]